MIGANEKVVETSALSSAEDAERSTVEDIVLEKLEFMLQQWIKGNKELPINAEFIEKSND